MSVQNKTKYIIVLALCVFVGIAAYTRATNTFPLGGNNSTVVIVHENNTKDSTPVSSPDTQTSGTVAGNNSPVIVNNNYVTVNNSIQVPASVQPSVTPDNSISSDEKLQKVETVKQRTVQAPEVIKQKSITIKTTDLYTGKVVKISQEETVKTGLELVDVNAGVNVSTGRKTCEYVTIKNNNAFDMGLGGYVLYVEETESGIQLPNINIGAGKTLKILTINGKPDTFDKQGYLVKFHLRLARELYPDDEPVMIYLLEPNFGEAISSIETKV
jgi:hypothetical protein